MDESLALHASLEKRILQLHSVEKLSMRQIARELKVSRDSISKVIRKDGCIVEAERESILDPYQSLIGQWYKEYPALNENAGPTSY